MKSLWKRLSNDNRKKIKESEFKYRSKNLKKILKYEVAWSNLKFEHVIQLSQLLGRNNVSIEFISDLFEM